MRNGKEAEEKEGRSEAEHLGERASTRQSCRDSGTVSQARLKYKWKFSLSRINAILVNEKKKGRLKEGRKTTQPGQPILHLPRHPQ